MPKILNQYNDIVFYPKISTPLLPLLYILYIIITIRQIKTYAKFIFSQVYTTFPYINELNSRNGTSYNHCEIFEYKEETQHEATQMTIEIMTATNVPYTITKEPMVLIDVTELAAIIDDYSEFC